MFFEPELALLVGLQVMSSKEGGRREGGREGELFDKILFALDRSIILLFGSQGYLGSDLRGEGTKPGTGPVRVGYRRGGEVSSGFLVRRSD